MPDLLAGNVSCVMEQISGAMPLAREGRLRLLALTGEQRSSLMPNLPTLVESGYDGAVMFSYNGLCAPTGTPDAIIRRLSDILPDCLADAVLHERMTGLGVELARPPQTTPGHFAAFLRADLERTRRAVQLAGLKPE